MNIILTKGSFLILVTKIVVAQLFQKFRKEGISEIIVITVKNLSLNFR